MFYTFDFADSEKTYMPVTAALDRQEAFFFVVPLEMAGRWRLLGENQKFDPDWTTIVDFEEGIATVTRCQPSDGGSAIAKQTGAYRADGGRLTIDFLDEDETGYGDRIEGASVADPDVVAVVRSLWHEDEPGEVKRINYTLVREELADALRAADAIWSGETFRKVH